MVQKAFLNGDMMAPRLVRGALIAARTMGCLMKTMGCFTTVDALFHLPSRVKKKGTARCERPLFQSDKRTPFAEVTGPNKKKTTAMRTRRSFEVRQGEA
jgi:hypothetical protein